MADMAAEDGPRITVRLDPNVRDALDLVAASEGTTSGALARQFLQDGLAEMVTLEYVERRSAEYGHELGRIARYASDNGFLPDTDLQS